MANNHAAYPVSFYFSVSFGTEETAFREVSGISKETAFEEIGSGGENRFKYKLPGPTTYPNLVLKRALVPAGSQLALWCAATIDAGLSAPPELRDISVSLMDASGSPLLRWVFFNAYPLKYAVSDLDAQASTLVIESVEMAYSYFEISSGQQP